MRYESRDGHLRAQLQTDEAGQEQLHIQDHRGNLLDVLVKVEPAAQAVGCAASSSTANESSSTPQQDQPGTS